MKLKNITLQRVHAQLGVIQSRYESLCKEAGVTPEDQSDTALDLYYVLLNFPCADLDILVNAPDYVFAHDIFGIKQHIIRTCRPGDEKTLGTLGDCFLPKFISRSRAIEEASHAHT